MDPIYILPKGRETVLAELNNGGNDIYKMGCEKERSSVQFGKLLETSIKISPHKEIFNNYLNRGTISKTSSSGSIN